MSKRTSITSKSWAIEIITPPNPTTSTVAHTHIIKSFMNCYLLFSIPGSVYMHLGLTQSVPINLHALRPNLKLTTGKIYGNLKGTGLDDQWAPRYTQPSHYMPQRGYRDIDITFLNGCQLANLPSYGAFRKWYPRLLTKVTTAPTWVINQTECANKW